MQSFPRFRTLLLGGWLLLAAGCAGPVGDPLARWPGQAPLVWPAPPEPARIAYRGRLVGEADLGQRSSWLHDLFFGRRDPVMLVNPYAVTVDPRGVVYVSDTALGVIHRFDLRRRSYGRFGDGPDGPILRKPVALAWVENRLVVVDSALRCVCVFDPAGRLLGRWGQDRLQRPSGVGVDPRRDRLYVSDTARHVIEVYDLGGRWLRSLGRRGTQAGQFNYPTQLWVDADGRLYVSDTLNYRVQVFDAEGHPLTAFGTQGNRPGQFAHPCGVATDRAGHIYVSDRQFENVQVFDAQGRILLAFGSEGRRPGQFWLPGGLFIDDQNRIYVADTFNRRIQIFQLLPEGTP